MFTPHGVATAEMLNIIAVGAAVFGAGIVSMMALRFTHFDKELKSLRNKVVEKAKKLDAQLDSQIKNPEIANKRTIKQLVTEMSANETRINEIDDIRKSIRGNFKFDWIVLVVLALIPVTAYVMNPIEIAYPPMFLMGLIVVYHITMFVSRVFEFMRIESQIEAEEEAERKKALGE